MVVEAEQHKFELFAPRANLEEAIMSKERIKISEDLYDIMPSDYQDLEERTYGKEDRGLERHRLVQGTHRAALALRRLPGVDGLPVHSGLAA